jgi:hypothetical protein
VGSVAERSLNRIADVFDLGRNIQFDTRVTAAYYREDTRSRGIVLEDGKIVIQRGRRFVSIGTPPISSSRHYYTSAEVT